MLSNRFLLSCVGILCRLLLCWSEVLVGVQIKSYTNPGGKVSEVQCCDAPAASPDHCPPDQCDTIFETCWHTLHRTGTFPVVTNNNSFEVGTFIGDEGIAQRALHATTIPYSPGNTTFSMTAFEESGGTTLSIATFELPLDWLDTNFQDPPRWMSQNFTDRQTQVEVVVDLFCMCKKGWEGPTCDDRVVVEPKPSLDAERTTEPPHAGEDLSETLTTATTLASTKTNTTVSDLPATLASTKTNTTVSDLPDTLTSTKTNTTVSDLPDTLASTKTNTTVSDSPATLASTKTNTTVSDLPDTLASTKTNTTVSDLPATLASTKTNTTVSDLPDTLASTKTNTTVSDLPDTLASTKTNTTVSDLPDNLASTKTNTTVSDLPDTLASTKTNSTVSDLPDTLASTKSNTTVSELSVTLEPSINTTSTPEQNTTTPEEIYTTEHLTTLLKDAEAVEQNTTTPPEETTEANTTRPGQREPSAAANATELSPATKDPLQSTPVSTLNKTSTVRESSTVLPAEETTDQANSTTKIPNKSAEIDQKLLILVITGTVVAFLAVSAIVFVCDVRTNRPRYRKKNAPLINPGPAQGKRDQDVDFYLAFDNDIYNMTN